MGFFLIIKIIVKKRRFDRSTVIFKLTDKIFSCAYIINCKNGSDILTNTLKYLHRNNTGNCNKNDKKR